MRICVIPGCGKPVEGRGWCAMHYSRWKRHGHPLKCSRPYRECESFTLPRVLRNAEAIRAYGEWEIKCCAYKPDFVVWFLTALRARDDQSVELTVDDFCGDCDDEARRELRREGRCVRKLRNVA